MNKMLRSSVIATAMMLSLAAQSSAMQPGQSQEMKLSQQELKTLMLSFPSQSSAMEFGNTQNTSQFGYGQSMLQKTQPVKQLTAAQ